MTQARMWMVRGEGGSLYDAFRERNVVAIGWSQLAAHAFASGTVIPPYLARQPMALKKGADQGDFGYSS